MGLNFEELFSACLGALIEQHGGSMESALDDITYTNEEEKRKAIKEWFDWDDEDLEPRDEEDLKDIFQDLASQYDECDDIEDALDGLLDSNVITDEEYDIIQEHWDEWLPEED